MSKTIYLADYKRKRERNKYRIMRKRASSQGGPVRHIDPSTGEVFKVTDPSEIPAQRFTEEPPAAPKKERRRPKDFYQSRDWKRARYEALTKYGNRCQCCGASADDGITKIVVDHIKPVRFYWELRLEISNLQILCETCNLGKGSRDKTDWRKPDDHPAQRNVIWGDEWPD